tara:strand:- start:274 stop:468 length:195 start_codon:yes stop_codon:yes gene_type:complete
MNSDWESLNDTLEEQLRRQLIDKNNEVQNLKAQIKILEQSVAQEQSEKYTLYKRIKELIKSKQT